MAKETPQPNETQITTIGKGQELFRYGLAHLLATKQIFPLNASVYTEIGPDGAVGQNAIDLAEELADEDRGFIFVYDHFSRDDPIRALMGVTLLSRKLRNRSVVIPIEMRQFEKFELLFNRVVPATGVKMHPLIIEDTIRKYGVEQEDTTGKKVSVYIAKSGEALTKGYGLDAYIASAKDAVLNGQSVLVPVTSGRRQSLYPKTPEEREIGPFSYLNRQIGREDAAKVAVVFIGMGLTDVEIYAEGQTDGFNRGQTMQYTFGPTVRLEDLRYEAKTTRSTSDELARSYLAKTVPAAYQR